MARKSRKKQQALQEVIPAAGKEKRGQLATAAYVRLSVENSGHEDDATLQTQIILVHDFIKKHPELTLEDTYADNGYTGTDFDRPEFDRLMEDVRNGRIQCVVVKDLSRFGRDYLEMGHYIETIFPRLGVRFIAVTDDFDSSRPEDVESLAVPIKNMVNSLYAKDISRKLLSSYESRRQRGERCGSFAPYGLQLPDGKKGYLKDEMTAPYVRAMYVWHLLGVNKYEAVRRLELLQAPTPRQRQRMPANSEGEQDGRNYVWNVSAVTRILGNQVYAGDTVTGKTRRRSKNRFDRVLTSREDWVITPDTHPAIILRRDYDAVQEIEDSSKEKWNQAVAQGAEERGKLPDHFKGLLYCAGCGKPLIMERRAHKEGAALTFAVYRCKKTDRRHRFCATSVIQEKLLRILVMDQICILIQAMCSRKTLVEELTRGNTDKNLLLSLDKKAAYLSGMVAQAEDRKGALYEDLASGLLDREEYQSLREHYILEIQKAEGKLQETRQRKEKLERKVKQYADIVANLEQYLNDRTFRAELVQELVERIEVSHDGSVSIRFKCNDVYGELTKLIGEIQDEG